MKQLADLVSEEFKNKVAYEIAEANRRAREERAPRGPRNSRRYKNSRFTEGEIEQFCLRYEAGESLRDILGKRYSELRMLFKARGLELRTKSEGIKMRRSRNGKV